MVSAISPTLRLAITKLMYVKSCLCLHTGSHNVLCRVTLRFQKLTLEVKVDTDGRAAAACTQKQHVVQVQVRLSFDNYFNLQSPKDCSENFSDISCYSLFSAIIGVAADK